MPARASRTFLLDSGAVPSATRSFRKEDILDKKVIETSGREIGKVRDVSFDLSGTITLQVEGPDGKVSQVPVSKVTGISDDVVVRGDSQPASPDASAGPKCRYCGKPIAPSQTWCPSCGRAQT